MAHSLSTSKQQPGNPLPEDRTDKAAPQKIDPECQVLDELIENAQSLAEIQAAIAGLTRWVETHPQDRERAYAVFEQLFLREEGAREALAEAEAMGLSPEEQEQRERVYRLQKRVHSEDAPEVFQPALLEARQALEAWVRCHPEDPQNSFLAEHLDMEEQVADWMHSILK